MDRGTKAPLIIGVIVTLAVAGGAVWWATNNNDNDTASNTTPTQSQQQTEQKQQPATKQTIVDVAAGNQDFSTLVRAVQAADLAGTLSDTTKEYTVFAPTNTAFNKLPSGTLDNLLLPASKQTLTSILTYHVVPSKVTSNQLTNGQVVQTVNGQNLTVTIEGGMVYITDVMGNRATVVTPDVKADNGVIHAIDTVVMPN